MGSDNLDLKARRQLPVLQAGSFSYRLGRSTTSGYGPSPLAREEALGSELHRDIVALVLNQRPNGFFRLTHKLSGRFFYKALHFLFARNAPGRIGNFIKYLYQRHRRAEVSYTPPFVFMDPSSACTLRCPGCATGLNLTRKRAIASLDLMRAVVDQVGRRSVQISFYHLGEAFLNDDVFEAVRYARSKGLWTLVNSHLSLNRPRLAERIVESGLHDLLISCDGASQSVYEHYRKGGSLDLVMTNLRNIREYRDRLGRKTPFLRTKMIVFEHNWHEARKFEELARANGADEVQFVSGNGAEIFSTSPVAGGSQFDIRDLSWREKVPAGPCQEVWLSMYVTPDGGAFSCCLGYKEKDLFVSPGSPIDINKMWNSASYRAARQYFLRQKPAAEIPGICQSCSYVLNFGDQSERPSRPKASEPD